MRIALGSDHRGVGLRRVIAEYLTENGYDVTEFGSNDHTVVDYPEIGSQVAKLVSRREAEYGILICGTGIGMCVVANKFPDVRAVPCGNDVTAALSRQHTNANVLCLSGDMLGERACLSLVKKWLETDFDGGRHQSRLDKINQIEKKCLCGSFSE